MIDNKVLTIGLAILFIGAFIGGFAAYNSLSTQINTTIKEKTAAYECQIQTNKEEIKNLANELRIKADVVALNKIDNRFDTVNYNLSEIKDRLARMETTLKYLNERKN